MNFSVYGVSESDFENARDPAARWFIRLPQPDGGGLVMEIREREYLASDKYFFRAEARPLWIEVSGRPFLRDQRDFKRWQNAVQVVIDPKMETVKFGPTGHIVMNPKGIGIGSYLMDRVILWLKNNFPDYRVVHGTLSSEDAKTETEMERRYRFYKSHGFIFEWTKLHISGSFYKPRAGDLCLRGSDSIKSFTVDDLAKCYCDSVNEQMKLSSRIKTSNRHMDEKETALSFQRRLIIGLFSFIALLISFPIVAITIQKIIMVLIGLQASG